MNTLREWGCYFDEKAADDRLGHWQKLNTPALAIRVDLNEGARFWLAAQGATAPTTHWIVLAIGVAQVQPPTPARSRWHWLNRKVRLSGVIACLWWGVEMGYSVAYLSTAHAAVYAALAIVFAVLYSQEEK